MKKIFLWVFFLLMLSTIESYGVETNESPPAFNYETVVVNIENQTGQVLIVPTGLIENNLNTINNVMIINKEIEVDIGLQFPLVYTYNIYTNNFKNSESLSQDINNDESPVNFTNPYNSFKYDAIVRKFVLNNSNSFIYTYKLEEIIKIDDPSWFKSWTR